LRVIRAFEHLAGQAALMHSDEWQRAFGSGLTDQGNADGVRDVVQIDQDFLALFESGGVTDELACEGVDAGVVHGWVIAGRFEGSKDQVLAWWKSKRGGAEDAEIAKFSEL
jgi:hypothetical protein